MDTANVENGLAHTVRAPGYVPKEPVYGKVDDGDANGIVRRMSTPVPSLFLKPQIPVHFEAFLGGRLCMMRGILSKEMTVADFDSGYVRDNHVWLVFTPKVARHVSIHVNPTPARENIWIVPEFTWDHRIVIEIGGEQISEPTATVMDTLAYVVSQVLSDDCIDSLSCESSRLRAMFAAAIIGGAKDMPDIKLPLAKFDAWNRNAVMRCWAQAQALVDPLSGASHLLL